MVIQFVVSRILFIVEILCCAIDLIYWFMSPVLHLHTHIYLRTYQVSILMAEFIFNLYFISRKKQFEFKLYLWINISITVFSCNTSTRSKALFQLVPSHSSHNHKEHRCSKVYCQQGPEMTWGEEGLKYITLLGTEPHPIETRQSIRASGHKSCASLMAKMVGLLATIAPSCQRLTSAVWKECNN